MTVSAGSRPLTARAFLFGDEDAADAISRTLREHGVLAGSLAPLGALNSAARNTVHHEIGSVVASVLDVDLADIAVAGWRKHAQLTAAARHSLVVPGSEEVLDLAAHRVTSVHRPYVDLLVNDVRVAQIHVALTATLEVIGLVAVVRAGRLVDIRCGDVDVEASVTVHTIPVAARRRRMDVGVLIHLGAGIPLVGPDVRSA